MYKCKNCGFESDIAVRPHETCVKCGDNTIYIPESQDVKVEVKPEIVAKPEPVYAPEDVNKDGKVDIEDVVKVAKKSFFGKKKSGRGR